MLDFIIAMAFFALVVLMIYLPVIRQRVIVKQAERKFAEELNLVGSLFESSTVIQTKRMGEGESQNSDITFEKAQQNQTTAVNSVMWLAREMAGE